MKITVFGFIDIFFGLVDVVFAVLAFISLVLNPEWIATGSLFSQIAIGWSIGACFRCGFNKISSVFVEPLSM